MQHWHKILIVYFVLIVPCYGGNQNSVCPNHLSTHWYPQSPTLLREKLQKYDTVAQNKQQVTINKIQAMIVPHDALDYSGEIAASCWRLVKEQKIKRVVILAPSHNAPFHGVLLPTCSSFSFPIGTLQVDTTCVHKLAQQKTLFKKNLDFVNNPFSNDNSLEMQLLFCSYYLPSVQILPLIVGTLTSTEASSVAMYLKDCADNHTLVVVSSDFIHYGPLYDYQPFAQDADFKNNITALNNKIITALLTKSDSKPLDTSVKAMYDTQATICGKSALMVLMGLVEKKVFEGAEPYLIGYATSDPTGKQANSVSYVGIVWGDSNGSVLPKAQ